MRSEETVGLPVHIMLRRSSGRERGSLVAEILQRIDAVGVRVRPTLFAYQYLFELTPSAPRP